MRALLEKDLRLHGRSIVAAHAGMVAFTWAATLLPRSTEALTTLIVSQNFLLALLWGDWFISAEKLKGTVAWLRTLPITDGELVAGKFVLTSACCTTLWLVTTVPFAARYFLDGRLVAWALLLLAVIAFGGVSAAVRWRFTQKLGLVVPSLIVGVPMAGLVAMERHDAALVRSFYAAWQGRSGQAILAVLLAALFVLSYLSTRAWVRRSDTFRILE